MIRVAILADRVSRLESLAEMLEEEGRLEVVEWNPAASESVDVILAIEISTARIPEDGPPVVTLGIDTLPSGASETLRAALPVSSSDAEIVAALIAAANNLMVLTVLQAKQVLRRSVHEEDSSIAVEHLTPRELEVLQMLSAGVGNKEIAARLGISPHTAKFHVAQIIAKLDAASRTEAVSIGIRRGLISI